MLRSEIEAFVKSKGMKFLSLLKEPSGLAEFTSISGGYLVDHTGHRVDRKFDFWGYVDWDSFGNGDAVAFDGSARMPFMREGRPVAPFSRKPYQVHDTEE